MCSFFPKHSFIRVARDRVCLRTGTVLTGRLLLVAWKAERRESHKSRCGRGGGELFGTSVRAPKLSGGVHSKR